MTLREFHILGITSTGNLAFVYHAMQVPTVGNFVCHNGVRYEVTHVDWEIKYLSSTEKFVDEVRIYVEKVKE